MKPQKRNTITITIRKPPAYVFSYVLDPKNTPKWLDSILEEQAEGWPPGEGTVYRNRNREGAWNEYTVTSFEADKTFVMKKADGNYHVQYTMRPAGEADTELEYYEWVIRGTLEDPFTRETLEKLKACLEG